MGIVNLPSLPGWVCVHRALWIRRAAINGNATLAAAGIAAIAAGNTVLTNGPLTSITIDDAGISHESVYSPDPVPTLGATALAWLGVSLLGAALVALRGRSGIASVE